MILASIFIGPPGRGEDIALPPMIAENIESLKRHHPQLPHRLFSGEDIEAFLEANFPRGVQDAYRALKPYAYKADLARYCILHEFGGVYADLAFYFTRPLPFDGVRPVVFQDLPLSAPWDTLTSVIAAPPGHRIFERAVELVCANVKRRYYGPTYLCPTGPTLFGKALASTSEPEDLHSGTSAVVARSHLQRLLNGAKAPVDSFPDKVKCINIEGEIVALSRKPLSSRGLGGVGYADRDYTAQWTARDVYEDRPA